MKRNKWLFLNVQIPLSTFNVAQYGANCNEVKEETFNFHRKLTKYIFCKVSFGIFLHDCINAINRKSKVSFSFFIINQEQNNELSELVYYNVGNKISLYRNNISANSSSSHHIYKRNFIFWTIHYMFIDSNSEVRK